MLGYIPLLYIPELTEPMFFYLIGERRDPRSLSRSRQDPRHDTRDGVTLDRQWRYFHTLLPQSPTSYKVAFWGCRFLSEGSRRTDEGETHV